MAAVILALYAWGLVSDEASLAAALSINTIAAVFAGISLAAGLVSHKITPPEKLLWGALAAFGSLVATIAVLIITTGGVASPFIALWMVAAIFAGVFGMYALLPMFAAITLYLVLEFLVGEISRPEILTVVLAGELPLAVSFLIWRVKSTSAETEDRSYRELASELSQVAGKSEVVINAIADGVIALDSQGIIQLINPAAQQIVGWGKQDALSLDYHSVLKLLDKKGEELQPSTDPITKALANNEQVTSNNLSLITNSGKKILVSIVVSPVGQLGSGVIVVFRDVTKERAEEREQAEFISTASHEMRTPVASIEGYLGLALNPATAQIDDKARDFITKAHEAAQHLGRLFQDLLDISKAEDGRLSNNPKAVDVVEFVHDIVQGLKPKAEEKGLRVLYKPQPDDEKKDKTSERQLNPVYYVNVDNDHLREVVANLMENAIKYTLKGDITIDVTGDNDNVTISVSDSGIGIPAEDMPHLFQKFYRVDNSDTREIGGTGLGLYLCRRLAEAMEGRIWAESQYKQGSTFYLELPRISHEDAMRLIEESSIEGEQEEVPALFTPEQTPAPAMPVPEAIPQPVPPAPEPIAAPTPAPLGERTYTNPPVETVVQQLQAMEPQAPQQQPPQPQQPIQQQYQAPQAPLYTGRSAQYQNTPLSNIEQNPSQYLRPRDGTVSIPPRDQNQA